MSLCKEEKENANLNQSRQLDDLKKTSANHAAVFFIPQMEIEEAILNGKDIVEMKVGQKDLGMGRERNMPGVQGKAPIVEGMTHYQG